MKMQLIQRSWKFTHLIKKMREHGDGEQQRGRGGSNYS
jgi:hypothetical protein